MNREFCNHAVFRRRQTQYLWRAAWAILLLASTTPAWAQSTGNNRAQATLHIQVNIVRVTATPFVHKKEESGEAVSFNVPDDAFKMSETREIRELTPAESVGLLHKDSGSAILETRTIVLP